MAGIVAKREAVGQNVFPGQSMDAPNTFDDNSSLRENPYSVSELAGNSRRERGLGLKVHKSIVLLTVILVCVVAVLLPFGQQCVYDGSFDLTLKLRSDPTIDESSVYFADCWRPVDVANAMRTGTHGEQRLDPGRIVGEHERLIEVPFSGRLSIIGFGGSYSEPKFLVVE